MKKLFFILSMALFAIACNTKKAEAQISLISSIDGTKTDTLSDTGTLYFTTPSNALVSEKASSYSLQYYSANISGTSTFKIIVQRTIDGRHWTNMHQVAGTNGVNCDTLQVTSNSPSTWVFKMNGEGSTNASRSKGIRAAVIGGATQKTLIGDFVLWPQY